MYRGCLQFVANRTKVHSFRSFSSNPFSKSFSLQCKKPEKQWHCLRLQRSNIHTTRPTRTASTVLIGFGAIVSGMLLRKAFIEYYPELGKQIFSKRYKIYVLGVAVTMIVTAIIYRSNLKQDPVLNKSRLVLIDESSINETARLQLKLLVESRDNIVPLSDERYERAANAIRKLAKANPDLFQNVNLKVTIINRILNIVSFPTTMLLPDGNIVILSKLFEFTTSDDQLMFNLAHEIAHLKLLHLLETPSVRFLYFIALSMVIFLNFTLYAPMRAMVLSLFLNLLAELQFLSYRRSCELEADKVGYELAARTCIDLREISVFWEIMKKFRDMVRGPPQVLSSILDTHPSIEKRMKQAMDDLPRLKDLQLELGCSQVSDIDPREDISRHTKRIEEEFWDVESYKIQ